MPGTLENITPSPIRGLVAFWNFDNSSSLTNDVAYTSFTTRTTGSGTNYLTAINSPAYASGGLIGTCSYTTNNVASYWRIANAASARLVQQDSNYVTFMGWGHHFDNANANGVVGKDGVGSGVNTAWGIFFPASGSKAKTMRYTHNSNNVVNVALNGSANITSNTWRQFVGAFDGLQNKRWMYVNSSEYFEATPNITTNNGVMGTRNFNIATLNDTSSSVWNGYIDEVGIWSGSRGGLSPTLTSNEVRFLYNNGLGRKYPFNSGP